jgi:hypothetical protein
VSQEVRLSFVNKMRTKSIKGLTFHERPAIPQFKPQYSLGCLVKGFSLHDRPQAKNRLK